jgi:cell division protein FtsW (lipid II flippase)
MQSIRRIGPGEIAAIVAVIMTVVAIVLVTIGRDMGTAVLVIFIGTYAIISSEKSYVPSWHGISWRCSLDWHRVR